MATRTQKAAMKKKAEAAKAEKAHAKAHEAAQAKVPKPTPKGKPAKKAAPKPKAAKPKPAAVAWEPVQEEALPEPKRTSFSERFWHRIGMRAQKKEEQAHRHEAEVEVAEAREEQARHDAEAAQRKAEAAEERRKSAQSARDLQRTAKEEEARMAEEARIAKAEKARAAREERAMAKEQAAREAAERKAAAAERRRAAREQAKAREAEPEPEPEAEEPEPEPAEEEAEEPVPVVTVVEAQDDEEPEAEEEEEDVEQPPRPAPEGPRTQLDEHADKLAAELASRRSKPITIVADDEEAVPTLPVGRATRTAPDTPKETLVLDPAPPARISEPPAPKGLSIPEHYLLLALDEGWDERTEKNRSGSLGGGLVGALLLELVLQGALKVQRDRFVLQNADLDDATEAVARKLQQVAQQPSLRAMGELAKWLPQLLPAYKDRMAARGLIAHKAWRHLGLAYRSQTVLLDGDAQERLRNKLARAIAGGGRPDAPTILSLGLLEASGLFGLVVPEGAQAYNRKRLNGLVAGKDVMGYKVDDQLKGVQEIAVRTILDNVRTMTVRG